MDLVEDILNGKHFPTGSREKLKATLVSLTLLLAAFIMMIDVYESISQSYIAMSLIESLTLITFLLTYSLFPRYISLETTIYVTVAFLGFLFIASLTVEGANPYFALFWLSTLPVYIFFFLGLERGLIWTLVALGALVLTVLNAVYDWYPPIYPYDFLIQLTVGYIAISYLLYALEKERQGYEENLLHALKEKETLLKEVHHRTKNNMQVMMALLDTQALKTDDPKYKKIFQAHVERLKSMAMVHEHLYSGEHFDTVNIGEYLHDITANMQKLTNHRIVTDIEDITVDMKTAMNLGLVYNEALSNALEHAYAEEEKGEIVVSLKRLEGHCLLRIKDFGSGFENEKQYGTLGLTLMKDLSRSLDCREMEIDVEQGTEVKIYCALNETRC